MLHSCRSEKGIRDAANVGCLVSDCFGPASGKRFAGQIMAKPKWDCSCNWISRAQGC
ncbi:hypothetical protein BRCON_0756 [Candidatus Sumerlaea chitinivorans]|uniref:Uncharacterized protein n=1 Tax=Sumerlaea chitinivorans TaxID=2250252 RepID=A0A2Z4Y4T7_SUMC1|nr:hypothetical protein BRCON_0756 [Candidatus Sumerlaea chitinivorans]